MWRADDDDAPLTKEEFYAAYDSLRTWISRHGKVGFRKGDDFYVIGDLHGDKTQDIEIVNPEKLTSDFLLKLQQWIVECYPCWRVALPSYVTPTAVVVVYRNTLRMPKGYDADVEEGLRRLREDMLRKGGV